MTNEEKRFMSLCYAWEWIGTPYIYGGESSMGADCSGFAQEWLRSVGEDPPGDQSAEALFWALRDKRVPEPAPGCMVFYGQSETDISHVGICITAELMIEAGGGGSKTKTVEDAHRHKAFVRMRPIDRRDDIIGYVDPFLMAA